MSFYVKLCVIDIRFMIYVFLVIKDILPPFSKVIYFELVKYRTKASLVLVIGTWCG